MSIDPFLYFNHILNIKRKSDFDMFSFVVQRNKPQNNETNFGTHDRMRQPQSRGFPTLSRIKTEKQHHAFPPINV